MAGILIVIVVADSLPAIQTTGSDDTDAERSTWSWIMSLGRHP